MYYGLASPKNLSSFIYGSKSEIVRAFVQGMNHNVMNAKQYQRKVITEHKKIGFCSNIIAAPVNGYSLERFL